MMNGGATGPRCVCVGGGVQKCPSNIKNIIYDSERRAYVLFASFLDSQFSRCLNDNSTRCGTVN